MPEVTPPSYYWILTIPHEKWTCPTALDPAITMIRGQLEIAASGFKHWQVVVRLKNKQRLSGLKALFPPETHAEPTRSAAATDYVWKEETRVPGTQFQLGQVKAAAHKVDWDKTLELATKGHFSEIESGVMLRCVACGR